jgi:multisubunit Na+/H+ antiporter MnhF subunit
MKIFSKSQENMTAHLVFMSIAASMVLYLFYIDEGRNTFKGLFSLDALQALLFWGMLIFGFQAAPFHLTERFLGFPTRIVLSLAFLGSFILAFFLAIS